MRENHAAWSEGGDKMNVALTCVCCNQEFTFKVPVERYISWRFGENVQTAFPEMPKEERELFISGTCNSCFQELFGPARPQ
jgi:hypothetical protein